MKAGERTINGTDGKIITDLNSIQRITDTQKEIDKISQKCFTQSCIQSAVPIATLAGMITIAAMPAAAPAVISAGIDTGIELYKQDQAGEYDFAKLGIQAVGGAVKGTVIENPVAVGAVETAQSYAYRIISGETPEQASKGAAIDGAVATVVAHCIGGLGGLGKLGKKILNKIPQKFKGSKIIQKLGNKISQKLKSINDLIPNKGFKSFNDLKTELGSPGEGNAWHHIVEQSQISKSGFSPTQVNNINNVIAIPHGQGTVHAKISGYYSSKQFFTGEQTVRQWLAGKSFQEQFEFGMNLLKEYGTVKPTNNGWVFTPF